MSRPTVLRMPAARQHAVWADERIKNSVKDTRTELEELEIRLRGLRSDQEFALQQLNQVLQLLEEGRRDSEEERCATEESTRALVRAQATQETEH